MARVNAYVKAGNEHRQTSVGGRHTNNSAWAWLNCDTAGGQSSISVRAEVCGLGLSSRERRRKDGDQRRAHFTVELPKPSEHVSVQIYHEGESLRQLAMIGATLCALKGAQQLAEGDTEAGLRTIKTTGEIVAELEKGLTDLPNVTLPGGVELRHALACVETVRRLVAGETHGN